VQKFAVQTGSFALQTHASAFCGSLCCNIQASEIVTSHTSPNSLDLFPSYYHMFGQLKQALRGWRLLDDEVKGTVHTWPLSQLETFFADGISRHLNHCTICIEKRGHNVEK
jgi:hypothetical protein